MQKLKTRLDIKIGDYVVIRKAGDVIPEVVKPVIDRRSGNEINFKMADRCPYCNEPLVRRKDEAAHFCENVHCEGRKVEGLIHYAGRDMMNIDGLGDKLVALLFEKKFLHSIPDIYYLNQYKQEEFNKVTKYYMDKDLLSLPEDNIVKEGYLLNEDSLEYDYETEKDIKDLYKEFANSPQIKKMEESITQEEWKNYYKELIRIFGNNQKE